MRYEINEVRRAQDVGHNRVGRTTQVGRTQTTDTVIRQKERRTHKPAT